MDVVSGFKLRDILLTLPEVAEFEWNQQKTPGLAYKAWKAFEATKEAAKPTNKEEI